MKSQVHLALLALLTGACLVGCDKEPEPEGANATAPEATASDSAANQSGTTTYYGTPEEQTKPANN